MKLNVGILASAMLCCSQLTLAVPMPHLNDYHALKEAVPPILSRSIKSSPPLTGSTLKKRSLSAFPDAFSQTSSQAASKRAGVAGSDESPIHGKPIESGQVNEDNSIEKREPNGVLPRRGGEAGKRDVMDQEEKGLEKREPSPWNLKDPRLNFGVMPGYKCAKPPCRRDDTAQEEEDLEKREPFHSGDLDDEPPKKKHHQHGSSTHPPMTRDIAADQGDSMEKRTPAPYSRYRDYTHPSGTASTTPGKSKPGHKVGHSRRGLAEDVKVASADTKDSLTKRDPAPWTIRVDHESFTNFYAFKDKPKEEGHHPWGWVDGKWVPLVGHHPTGGHHGRP